MSLHGEHKGPSLFALQKPPHLVLRDVEDSRRLALGLGLVTCHYPPLLVRHVPLFQRMGVGPEQGGGRIDNHETVRAQVK